MTLDPDFDNFFKRTPPPARARLGLVVGGSLSQGVLVKLDPGQVPGGVIEGMAVGKYVVVEGKTGRKFFSIVTDIALDSTNPDLARMPPDADDEFTTEVYGSELAYGTLNIAPMLLLERTADGTAGKPKPVKT